MHFLRAGHDRSAGVADRDTRLAPDSSVLDDPGRRTNVSSREVVL